MLLASKDLAKKPKIYFTHGLLPKFIDPKQPPYGQKPFSTILRTEWVHSVDLVFPSSVHTSISPGLESLPSPEYYLLTVPLLALLSPPLFPTIQTLSISLLARPVPGPDSPHFALSSGVLTISLPKSLYERAGLQGRPVRDGTAKHIARRWQIDCDLRSPAFQQGAKGLERLRRACKEVLTENVRWLVCEEAAANTYIGGRSEDVPMETGEQTPASELEKVLADFEPVRHIAKPETTHFADVHVPDMRPWSSRPNATSPSDQHEAEDEAMDLLEYLGLATLGANRIYRSEDMDSFLSRWQIPGPTTATVDGLVSLRWRGLLPGAWVRRLVLTCMAATRADQRAWWAIAARSFTLGDDGEVEGWTMLRTRMEEDDAMSGMVAKEGQNAPLTTEFLMWEMVDCINK